MSDRSSSSPPEATGRHSAVPPETPTERAIRVAEEARADARRAVRDATVALDRVAQLEVVIGEPPNPLLRSNGSGLQESIYGLRTSVDGLSATITKWETTLAAREAVLVRIGWILASLIITALFAAVLAYLSGFHR